MGTSKVSFHGRGFSFEDWRLRVWWRLLARAIWNDPTAHHVLGAMRAADEFDECANRPVVGLASTDLNQLSGDAHAAVLRAALTALLQIRELPDPLPKALVNSLLIEGRTNFFGRDIPRDWIAEIGSSVVGVLSGTFAETDAQLRCPTEKQ